MTVNIAVIGCGALANGAHLPTIAASANLNLQVCCDRDPVLAKNSAEKWGANRFCTDWQDVIDSDDVDMIVLCTHTNLRAAVICPALKKGIPVYTEKPMTNSREEMIQIFKANQETGVSVCVGHNRRSSPAFQEFKRLLGEARKTRTDRISVVDRDSEGRELVPEEFQTQVLLRMNDDARSWKPWIFDDEQGIIYAEMVHLIDISLLLNTSHPVEVYAVGSSRGNFTQIITFADGSLATLQHTMVGNFDYPKELYEVTYGNVSIAMDQFVEVRQRGLQREAFKTTFELDTGAELTELKGIDGFHDAVEKFYKIRIRPSSSVPQNPKCLSDFH